VRKVARAHSNAMQKTILITGATAGIGRATAELLAKEGARLIITGRREALLRELAESLPVPTHAMVLDVTDRDSIAPALAALPPEFQAMDALVNNAGLALGLESADQASLADWETMVETNILGLLAMTRAILPGMKARRRGHIVNLSSIAGSYAYPGANVYGASKAFVTHFSSNLRSDLLGTPIRVTNIEPGMVETEFSNVRFKGDEARAGAVYEGTTPLSAQDIAETIRWALAQPAHVNINRIEIMPVCQALGGPKVHRT
jgi:3-hydroxy acid dehydrogenase/malonic semialdehyde reductase